MTFSTSKRSNRRPSNYSQSSKSTVLGTHNPAAECARLKQKVGQSQAPSTRFSRPASSAPSTIQNTGTIKNTCENGGRNGAQGHQDKVGENDNRELWGELFGDLPTADITGPSGLIPSHLPSATPATSELRKITEIPLHQTFEPSATPGQPTCPDSTNADETSPNGSNTKDAFQSGTRPSTPVQTEERQYNGNTFQVPVSQRVIGGPSNSQARPTSQTVDSSSGTSASPSSPSGTASVSDTTMGSSTRPPFPSSNAGRFHSQNQLGGPPVAVAGYSHFASYPTLYSNPPSCLDYDTAMTGCTSAPELSDWASSSKSTHTGSTDYEMDLYDYPADVSLMAVCTSNAASSTPSRQSSAPENATPTIPVMAPQVPAQQAHQYNSSLSRIDLFPHHHFAQPNVDGHIYHNYNSSSFANPDTLYTSKTTRLESTVPTFPPISTPLWVGQCPVAPPMVSVFVSQPLPIQSIPQVYPYAYGPSAPQHVYHPSSSMVPVHPRSAIPTTDPSSLDLCSQSHWIQVGLKRESHRLMHTLPPQTLPTPTSHHIRVIGEEGISDSTQKSQSFGQTSLHDSFRTLHSGVTQQILGNRRVVKRRPSAERDNHVTRVTHHKRRRVERDCGMDIVHTERLAAFRPKRPHQLKKSQHHAKRSCSRLIGEMMRHTVRRIAIW